MVNGRSVIGLSFQQVAEQEARRREQERFVGPVRPGTDEPFFRKTGRSRPEEPTFAGPLPEDADVETFRQTGITTPSIEQQDDAQRTQTALLGAKPEQDFIGPVQPTTQPEAPVGLQGERFSKQFFLRPGEKFTKAEIRKAERLIFQGRQGAARGDPRLTRLIGILETGGQRSIGETQRQEKIFEFQQKQRQAKVSESLAPDLTEVEKEVQKDIALVTKEFQPVSEVQPTDRRQEIIDIRKFREAEDIRKVKKRFGDVKETTFDFFKGDKFSTILSDLDLLTQTKPKFEGKIPFILTDPSREFRKRITPGIEKATPFIETSIEKITEFVSPSEKKRREEAEKIIATQETKITDLETDIKQFEAQFIGRELPLEEFEEATARQEKLEARREAVIKSGVNVESRLKQIEEEKRKQSAKIKVPESLAVGFTTAIPNLLLLGAGAITKPFTTAEQATFGLGEEFVKDPVRVGSELAGFSLFVGLTTKGGRTRIKKGVKDFTKLGIEDIGQIDLKDIVKFEGESKLDRPNIKKDFGFLGEAKKPPITDIELGQVLREISKDQARARERALQRQTFLEGDVGGKSKLEARATEGQRLEAIFTDKPLADIVLSESLTELGRSQARRRKRADVVEFKLVSDKAILDAFKDIRQTEIRRKARAEKKIQDIESGLITRTGRRVPTDAEILESFKDIAKTETRRKAKAEKRIQDIEEGLITRKGRRVPTDAEILESFKDIRQEGIRRKQRALQRQTFLEGDVGGKSKLEARATEGQRLEAKLTGKPLSDIVLSKSLGELIKSRKEKIAREGLDVDFITEQRLRKFTEEISRIKKQEVKFDIFEDVIIKPAKKKRARIKTLKDFASKEDIGKSLGLGEGRIKSLDLGEGRIKDLKLGEGRIKDLDLGEGRIKDLDLGEGRIKGLDLGESRFDLKSLEEGPKFVKLKKPKKVEIKDLETTELQKLALERFSKLRPPKPIPKPKLKPLKAKPQPKQPTFKFELEPTPEPKIIKDIGTGQQLILEPLKLEPPKPKTKPPKVKPIQTPEDLSLGTNRFAGFDLGEGRIREGLGGGKIGSLGDIKTRFSGLQLEQPGKVKRKGKQRQQQMDFSAELEGLEKQLTKQVTKSKPPSRGRLVVFPRTRQDEFQVSGLKQLPRLKQPQKIKQTFGLGLIQPPRQPQIQKQPLLTPPVIKLKLLLEPPTSRLKPLIIFGSGIKKKKKKTKEELRREALFFAPGFTARALKIKKQVKLKDLEKEVLKQATRKGVSIGIRPELIIR